MKRLISVFFILHLHFQIFFNFLINEIFQFTNIFSKEIRSLFNYKAVSIHPSLKKLPANLKYTLRYFICLCVDTLGLFYLQLVVHPNLLKYMFSYKQSAYKHV